MLDLKKELNQLNSISDTLASTINKLEDAVQNVQNKDKSFLLHSINGIKESVKGKANINDIIENLNKYAGSRS